jgi:DNA-directed RNA polymerase III subunit RPC1
LKHISIQKITERSGGSLVTLAYVIDIHVQESKLTTMEALNLFKNELRNVVICGIYSKKLVNKRAIINAAESGGVTTFKLQVESDALLQVMGIEGVDSNNVSSNNVKGKHRKKRKVKGTFFCDFFFFLHFHQRTAVEKVLGIEAARTTIAAEVQKIMQHHGIVVDHRHTMLLADLMTASGTVLACTRHGLKKMKNSALMLASFEQTEDHLTLAALRGRTDPVRGVSERIIVGQQIHLGTGSVQMWQKYVLLIERNISLVLIRLFFFS